METRVLETPACETLRENFLASWPDISYRKALNCRFTLDHITYTVKDCPGNVFQRFIRECGRVSLRNGSWKPIHQENLLRLLEKDCSDVARWYCLNSLLEHKVRVPLEIG